MPARTSAPPFASHTKTTVSRAAMPRGFLFDSAWSGGRATDQRRIRGTPHPSDCGCHLPPPGRQRCGPFCGARCPHSTAAGAGSIAGRSINTAARSHLIRQPTTTTFLCGKGNVRSHLRPAKTKNPQGDTLWVLRLIISASRGGRCAWSVPASCKRRSKQQHQQQQLQQRRSGSTATAAT